MSNGDAQTSVRNPRRRQRQSDGDSVRTAPRRKRSKISEDMFVPPTHDEEGEADEEVNGTIEVAATVNGDFHHTSSGRGRGRAKKESATMSDMSIPVREKKNNSVKRPTRGDGAILLTQNERYSAKLLPSTPKELRKEGVEYRGSLDGAHHALAVFKDKAYIWDYTSHSPISSPRSFDVPFTVKTTDPLPFGALVTVSTTAEIGLLLISATTAQVVYYESIEQAATLGLFQERNAGVEGSLGSLFAGEIVIDLTPASHAGFIVTLSSGRIIQLTLRDAQGKARVSAQFLRATEQSSGGIFGSIKGMLGGAGWRRDVTAVRTRATGTRGQMQVLALTERAELQIWDIDWSGHYTFKGTIDCRDVAIEEVRKLSSPEMQGRAENIAALDFAILEKPSTELATIGAEVPIDLAVFLRNGTEDHCNYVLLELAINGRAVKVGQVKELDSCRSRSSSDKLHKPRLLLPKPCHTAFVAFEGAITLAAMDEVEADGPEAQLHASYIQPAPFEDTMYFRRDQLFTVLGACEEDTISGRSSMVAFVKNAGLVRISAVDPSTTQSISRIPIKTRIEQAVFQGALQDGNIVDFSLGDESANSPEGVEIAALQISEEILRSTSPFVNTSPTSMETHLAQKALALRALVTHVRRNYLAMSKASMWQLLWDAEKVAAGQQMWKTSEEHVAASSQKKRVATVMDEACALVEQRLNPGSKSKSSNDDAVQSFFIYGLDRIEQLLPLVCDFLRLLQHDAEYSAHTKARHVVEADDLWNQALETVFAFRTEHGATYGILPELMNDGVLTDVPEHAELSEFWTSTEPMLKSVVNMCRLSRAIAQDEFEKNDQDKSLEPLIQRASAENPRLVQLMCLIYQERINWLASRSSERQREMAEKLRQHYDDTRYEQLRALAEVAQTEAGMRLAEKYKDMHTLTELVLAEVQFWVDELAKAPEEQKGGIVQYMKNTTARIGMYFDRFGDDWANAYFDEGFAGTQAGVMFSEAQERWEAALTKYLRAEPSRARICWINDIIADQDFGHSHESLMLAATDQETRLWSKKTELSMAKLAALAVKEGLEADGEDVAAPGLAVAVTEREIEVVDIQEQIYQHLLPEITNLLDRQAELEVAMQKFSLKNQDMHNLRQLLEVGLDRVLNHAVLEVDELIDILTLMDSYITEDVDKGNMQGQEFYLALRVLNAAAPSMPPQRVQTLLQIIWKRCYLYDDWITINSSQKQSSEDINQTLKFTVAWHTLYFCIDQSLFDRPDCNIRFLLPSECLGAGCLPEDLAYRWPDLDILDSILHDNKIQDEQLQGFVTDRRLDQWIERCVELVNGVLDQEGEEKAARLLQEREFEESEVAEEFHGNGNGNGKHANGHPNGSDGDEFEDDGDGGESGSGNEDVDMA